MKLHIKVGKTPRVSIYVHSLNHAYLLTEAECAAVLRHLNEPLELVGLITRPSGGADVTVKISDPDINVGAVMLMPNNDYEATVVFPRDLQTESPAGCPDEIVREVFGRE